MRKIILNLGNGTLTGGYPSIIGEVMGVLSSPATDPSSEPTIGGHPSRFTGQLPAALELSDTQQRWQELYYARSQDLSFRINILQRESLRYSAGDFNQLCADLVGQLNQWLNSPEFLPVDRALRSELAKADNAQIILETSDPHLRKLPWHLWQLFESYPRAELSFSSSDWQPLSVTPPPSSQPRILSVFGNSNDLDLSADMSALSGLAESSQATLSVLESPSLSELHEQLWQPEGWDIFFFAGHSKTQGTLGVIDLNQDERLTIDQIKFALIKAVRQGLKIAIFNSCDGLGLAQQLSDLQVPYVVVMREPIPDYVAQKFLQYLLAAFVAGAPFHAAVGEARQRLAGLDTDVPCTSWLPVVWQNPTAPAIYWQDWQRPAREPVAQVHRGWRSSYGGASPSHTGLRSSIFKSCLVSSMVLALRALGLLEPFELAAYDYLLRLRPLESVDPRIVVVEIAEESTSKYGYPLPDEVLTTAIDQIAEGSPLAVGLDLHRAQPKPAQAKSAQEPIDQGNALLTSATNNAATSQFRAAPTQALSEGHNRFLQQVEQTPNLFLVCSYSSPDENFQVPIQLSEQTRVKQVGFSDLPIDVPATGLRESLRESRGDLFPKGNAGLRGAWVRRQLLSYEPKFAATPSTCITPYSFSFQLAFEYLYENDIAPLEVTPDHHWKFGSVVFHSLAQRVGGYQSLETTSTQILLNYRAGQPAQKVSIEQLMSGSFDVDLLRDRVVLVGYNAPVSKDYFETPYGPMPGLWVHTHMVSQLVSAVLDDRALIHTLPQWGLWQWGDMLWIFSWSGLAGYVSWAMKRRSIKGLPAPSLWLLSVGLGALLLYGTCWLAIVGGLWLPLVPSALASLGAAVSVRQIRPVQN